MDVIDLPLGQIIPYARNPRRNEKAIATVAPSIKEFGWRQPIVADWRRLETCFMNSELSVCHLHCCTDKKLRVRLA